MKTFGTQDVELPTEVPRDLIAQLRDGVVHVLPDLVAIFLTCSSECRKRYYPRWEPQMCSTVPSSRHTVLREQFRSQRIILVDVMVNNTAALEVLGRAETPKDNDTRNQLRPHLCCHRRALLLVFFFLTIFTSPLSTLSDDTLISAHLINSCRCFRPADSERSVPYKLHWVASQVMISKSPRVTHTGCGLFYLLALQVGARSTRFMSLCSGQPQNQICRRVRPTTWSVHISSVSTEVETVAPRLG